MIEPEGYRARFGGLTVVRGEMLVSTMLIFEVVENILKAAWLWQCTPGILD